MGPEETEFNAEEYPAEYVVVGVSDGMSSILERIEEAWTRTPNAVLIIPRDTQVFHNTQDFLALGKALPLLLEPAHDLALGHGEAPFRHRNRGDCRAHLHLVRRSRERGNPEPQVRRLPPLGLRFRGCREINNAAKEELQWGGACFETRPLRDAACGGSSGQAALLSMR